MKNDLKKPKKKPKKKKGRFGGAVEAYACKGDFNSNKETTIGTAETNKQTNKGKQRQTRGRVVKGCCERVL